MDLLHRYIRKILKDTVFFDPIQNIYHKRLAKKWTDQDYKMINFYSQFIKSGSLCFDVGANIGNRTKVFLKMGAKVVSVEPQNNCIEILKGIYGNNPNFSLIEMALGATDGESEMLISDVHQISSLSKEWIDSVKKSGRFPTAQWRKSNIVKVTTLDRLIEEYGIPDFVKIDVEGFEYQVIQGLSKPIKTLSFEFTIENHEAMLNVLSHLASIGKIKCNFSIGESLSLLFKKWELFEDIYQIILATNYEGKLLWGDIYVKFQ